MSQRPTAQPIGLQLGTAARVIRRAFDDALAEAGGSLSTWLVLMSLKSQPRANQKEIAAAVGIKGATLTHHLNGMEADGLLTRRRDAANRRVHLVELTGRGDKLFHTLRAVAVEHDRRLRSGLTDAEITVVRRILAQLQANVTDAPQPRTRE